MSTILEKTNKILNEKNEKLLPENIRSGKTIFGISGNLIELKGQTKEVNPSINEQAVIPDNNYNGLTKVTVKAVDNTIDENIKAENIREGTEILGTTGTLKVVNNQDKEITENGTYVADNNYTGLGRIIVNVSQENKDIDFECVLTMSEGRSLSQSITEIKKMPDLSNETNLAFKFENLNNLIKLPDNLNTSKAIHLNSTFSGCSSLTEIPNLDTSNVERNV